MRSECVALLGSQLAPKDLLSPGMRLPFATRKPVFRTA